MSREGPRFIDIPRVHCPSYEEFHRTYDIPQKPVVITGAMRNWSAIAEWSFEWFRQRHGDTPVSLSLEPTHTTRAKECTLAEYVDAILAGKDEGLYLDQCSFDRLPGLESCVERRYANPARKHVELNLWLGPAGTIISLHKDNHHDLDHINNVFAQVVGRKRVVLAAPDQDPCLYQRVGHPTASHHSAVDWEAPDFLRFPRFREATLQQAVLAPGEMLFIPGNYWHSLRSLDPSISVSCWWRRFRLTDVVWGVVSGKERVPDQITPEDVREVGGAERLSAAWDSPAIPRELLRVVYGVMAPEARAQLNAWRNERGLSSLEARAT